MSHIPIDTQLRAMGLRRARAGESSMHVYLRHKDNDLAVQTVPHTYPVNEMNVVLMRGFVATLLERYPEMPLSQARLEMIDYSSTLGATDAEVTQASLKLELVRE